ncbi:selenoprotein Pb-like [Dendronephthya gigantea]|uniref:selenoprotein Pb-like n=1 Tax=Dendronephthya gigantea TaxID=151771 RepID=UPI00106D8480|nr:selenoprotein Pb-like [Dendronephthya gigantea]
MWQYGFFGVFIFLFPYLSIGLQLRCCTKLPPLMIDGKNIFDEKKGSHTLVAFVEGNRKDSRKQVKGLDLILYNFKNMDVLDINFMAINRKNDSGIRHLKRRAAFDVYQEPKESTFSSELGINTNDFIIFDHCGYMVGSSTFPSNFLWKQKGRVCTDRLIRNTYTKTPCKKYWTCLQTKQQHPEENSEEQSTESEVFSILESSGGSFNSPQ